MKTFSVLICIIELKRRNIRQNSTCRWITSSTFSQEQLSVRKQRFNNNSVKLVFYIECKMVVLNEMWCNKSHNLISYFLPIGQQLRFQPFFTCICSIPGFQLTNSIIPDLTLICCISKSVFQKNDQFVFRIKCIYI